MKKILFITCLIWFQSFSVAKLLISPPVLPPLYDPNYVDISTAKWGKGSGTYHIITMNRTDQHIKAKYFAFKEAGQSVYQRYMNWKRGKNIVLVSSGTYVDIYDAIPDGLTIDNGELVNRHLNGRMNGFVVVYNTGGVAVADLSEKKVNMECQGKYQSYNIANTFDLEGFISCAKDARITGFQTHLLAYKDQLKISPAKIGTSSAKISTRRFLAICKQGNRIFHVVIMVDQNLTLFDASYDVFRFLKDAQQMDEIVAMVNLDTGAQDVFQVYSADGHIVQGMQGERDMSLAGNLLVYYYE